MRLISIGLLVLTTLSVNVAFVIFSTPLAQASSGGVFISTGSMSVSRIGHTATLLQNGKVLVTGGDGSANTAPYHRSAEIYDPATGVFTPTGDMNERRSAHTATLLPDGKVLIAGGITEWVVGKWVNSAEIYDPATGVFTPTGNMNGRRGWHEAAMLSNGKVLIVGGYDNGTYLSSTELYDPATGVFTPSGNMNTPRIWFALNTLANGKVLVAGGSQAYAGWTNTTEIYDPATGTFTNSAHFTDARWILGGTVLPDNSVLYNGGIIQGDTRTNQAERYNVSDDTMTVTGSMNSQRHGASQSLLSDGTVLVTGGYGSNSELSSAEIYNPTLQTFTVTTNNLISPRYQHRAVSLPSGDVLLIGGQSGRVMFQNTAELYKATVANPGITLTSTCATVTATPLTVGVVEGGVCDVRISVADDTNSPVNLSSSQGLVTKTGTSSWLWHFNATNGPSDNTEVTFTATNGQGVSSTAVLNIVVANSIPVVGTVTIPLNPVNLGTPVIITATYSDAGAADTHTCTINFGDDTSEVTGSVQQGICTANHIYLATGVYTVTVTVTDSDGGQATKSASSFVVVYNSNGGSVLGNGQIISPVNSLRTDPSNTGPAKFGFSSDYKMNAVSPTGDIKFEIKSANFKFESTNYSWLVVSPNSQTAQFYGTGTINGAGVYTFTAWVADKTLDTFRIKITSQNGTVVYDNNIDQVIDKGQIKIKLN